MNNIVYMCPQVIEHTTIMHEDNCLDYLSHHNLGILETTKRAGQHVHSYNLQQAYTRSSSLFCLSVIITFQRLLP